MPLCVYLLSVSASVWSVRSSNQIFISISMLCQAGQWSAELIIQPRERSEQGCTKSYRGLGTHFWTVNNHFLIARRGSGSIYSRKGHMVGCNGM